MSSKSHIQFSSPERLGIGLLSRKRIEDYSRNPRVMSLQQKITSQAQYLDHLMAESKDTDNRLADLKTKFLIDEAQLRKLKAIQDNLAQKYTEAKTKTNSGMDIKQFVIDYVLIEKRILEMRRKEKRLIAETYESMEKLAIFATNQLKGDQDNNIPQHPSDLGDTLCRRGDSPKILQSNSQISSGNSASYASTTSSHIIVDNLIPVKKPSLIRRVRNFFRKWKRH